MTTNTQWTRSGWDRENAILQGLLAQGYPLAQAQQMATAQAQPMTADYAMGLVLIFFFKWIVLPTLLLIVVVGGVMNLLGVSAEQNDCTTKTQPTWTHADYLACERGAR